ncbi:hypothetical protein FKP32DRAFT_1585494 [Trametes sanguinea]|nr:hypothetical protein FKP32DRAFT_1585494 [Trametes sanguinea]
MPPLYAVPNTAFSLDISALAGFLGADATLAVMMLPHLHAQRKWWGWYNCPGSYHLAKRFGQMARSKFRSLADRSSVVSQQLTLELQGGTGLTYISAHSGATLPRTGPLASTFAEQCSAVHAIEVGGRRSDTMDVAVTRLTRETHDSQHIRVPHTHPKWFALCPVAATLSTAIACIFYRDMFIAFVILFSALCHGTACLVMGNAKFTYQHRIPQVTARFSSGWMEAHRSFVVLFGTEPAIAPVTRGRFVLKLSPWRMHFFISLCSVLLALQFLSQLLLVPQGTLFGQLMFIASLVASWAYHRLVLAWDNESIQRHILVADILGRPHIERYRFGTRTAAAVFTVLVLRSAIGHDIEARLRALLPTNTPVWELWYATVAERIHSGQPLSFEKECDWEWQKMRGLLTLEESSLFRELLQDAATAYTAFLEHRPEAMTWSRQLS